MSIDLTEEIEQCMAVLLLQVLEDDEAEEGDDEA